MARVQLVIPCYNEAGRLDTDAFLQLVASRRDVELLFVDDGSTDATAAVLADVARQGHGQITVLSLPRNVGKAGAVQRGVLAAFERHPEFVGYWDADLSTPLAALQDFIDVFHANPGLEIVIGARVMLLGRHIERSPIRHYFGRVFATAASLTLNVGVYDTQCGAKIFRANETVRHAFTAPFRSKWIFDVEILARYIDATGTKVAESRISELPLKTWTDVPGSKVTARDGLRAFWDLALIWRRPA
jgi:dolichyl-phosphate beta-glucosyltransferase